MTNEDKAKVKVFIDNNCKHCSLQKPLMPKARCQIWHGLDSGNENWLANKKLFWNKDDSCKCMVTKEKE